MNVIVFRRCLQITAVSLLLFAGGFFKEYYEHAGIENLGVAIIFLLLFIALIHVVVVIELEIRGEKRRQNTIKEKKQ